MSDYWGRFLEEATSTAETNFKFPFDKLCKKYGKAYREYIKLAYLVKDDLSDLDFCRLNHLPSHLLASWVG